MIQHEPELIQPNGEVIAQLSGILTESANEILGRVKFMKRKTVAGDRHLRRQLKDVNKPPKRDQDNLCRSINAS